MEKKDVAHLLEQIASFLELKGENPFRIRAFHSASRAISAFSGDLREAVASGELGELRGIGPGTLEIVSELLERGHSSYLDRLQEEVAPGLVDMLQISGLGVTKVRQISEHLGITTLDELEEAARDGRLARLPRFGSKTSDRILRALEQLRQTSEFRLYHHARREAESLLQTLQGLPGVSGAHLAGDLRRRLELIRQLDFVLVVEGESSGPVEMLRHAPGVTDSRRRDDRVTLTLASGTVAQVSFARPQQAGFDLVVRTGSSEHTAQLEELASASGIEWTPTGLRAEGRTLECRTEGDFYSVLELPDIPPELREGRGEIEAARRGELPALVTTADVRGFLHCHTDYSDGSSTVEEWADECTRAGFEYVGITDHSFAARYAGGLEHEAISRQHGEIDRVNEGRGDFRVLKGVEADILPNGELDYTPETRASFDFIIASIHTRFGMGEQEMTDRILRAMEDPSMTILGHPTGRLLLTRDPYPLDFDAIFEKAADTGIAIEINADPQRLDLDWRRVRHALEKGATISIGADAHSTTGIENIELGVGVARKGWVEADRLLNALPVDEFLDRARERAAR